MTTATDRTDGYTIGELLTSADWACAHGDAETVAYLARQIAERIDEVDVTLHDQLIVIAERYVADEEGASEDWTAVRARLHDLLFEVH